VSRGIVVPGHVLTDQFAIVRRSHFVMAERATDRISDEQHTPVSISAKSSSPPKEGRMDGGNIDYSSLESNEAFPSGRPA